MNVKIIKTKRNCEPMQEYSDFSFVDWKHQGKQLINIYPNLEYQTVKGFGGAFTEAASTTLDKVSKENREKVIKMYFDPEEGIGYTVGRVHMNSCDFSLGNYTCVDEGDETLETFQINRDKASVIPMIKEAQALSDISFFASPWSPPAYMKTSGQMNQGGSLKKEYYELWSQYFVKFIEEYKKNGINISAVTVQNEPAAAPRWESCVYTPEEESYFVKNHLGKKMKDMGVKVMFWDHNRSWLLDRALAVLADKEAAEYIDAVACHWYRGDHFENLAIFHDMFPDKEIFFSEGCYEYSLGEMDTVKIGEKYAHDIIGNFNNYCSTFCDWNLVLDENGGPNHVGNLCDAPIMIDTKNDKIYVHDSYYYIGHFSKYVKKGAKRIGSSKWCSEIDTVSFKNPDGTIVSVVLNRTNDDLDFAFKLGDSFISCKAEARSIATYIFED